MKKLIQLNVSYIFFHYSKLKYFKAVFDGSYIGNDRLDSFEILDEGIAI